MTPCLKRLDARIATIATANEWCVVIANVLSMLSERAMTMAV